MRACIGLIRQAACGWIAARLCLCLRLFVQLLAPMGPSGHPAVLTDLPHLHFACCSRRPCNTQPGIDH